MLVAFGLLTVVMDSLSNASMSSCCFTEGAFYVKCFLYPWVTTKQGPHIFIVALVYGINGG